MIRKEKLVNEGIYHIYNKSIAGFSIFNNTLEFERMKSIISYYQISDMPIPFSRFIKTKKVLKKSFSESLRPLQKGFRLVQIIAYCIMPTHIHLILKQLKDDGISIFMAKGLNSYTRYFNEFHERKGPLWQARFKNVTVRTDEQLLHLTRYIHLNPVTANLAKRPQDWSASSYREYIARGDGRKICDYKDLLDIKPGPYAEFVKEGIAYQKELNLAKKLAL